MELLKVIRHKSDECELFTHVHTSKCCVVIFVLRHFAASYTRKNAHVATDLQTSCNKSVHKLLTRCIRTACSKFVGTSLQRAVDKL